MSQVVGAGYFFMPDQFLPLFIVFAGIAWVVGAKRVATGLLTFAVLAMILPALLQPLVELVPVWLLWVFGVYVLFLVPYFLLGLFGTLVAPALGRKPANTMIGEMAAVMSVKLLAAPFRLVGTLFRGVASIFRSMRG